MKLIYAYIKHFRNIDNQEIYFSDGFIVNYNSNLPLPTAIRINKTEVSQVTDVIFRDSQLADVHIIVGKTGAGKTNIFQMIGMPEEERLKDTDASYFLLYLAENTYVLEPFNFEIDETVIPHRVSREVENKLAEELLRMPDYVQEHMRLRDSMRMFRFSVDSIGKPCNIQSIGRPDELDSDMTYIFNGYERHAFPFCPYEETRLESAESNTIWQTRVNAEYHKTTLWNSCRFLKEYIDTFDTDNIKRKAALVINVQNWTGRIKQHIDEKLMAHDYWTFIECKRQDDERKALGKPVKERKYPAIRHQFVHDLWTDYATYFREWIAYIQMWPNEIDPEHVDASGTADVFQEYIDYWYEKQLEEGKENGKRGRNPIDPTSLPDFEDISILKRLEWLSMWIDRRGDGTPYYLLHQIFDDIKDIGNILNQFDDKYFTNETFTLPIEEMYSEKNKQLVEDLFERMEQYRPDDTGLFTEELLPYHFSCISSGEYQFAKVLGGIEEFCVKLSTGGGHPNLIYLLDEPETYMHPELCRTFMKRLDTLLQERNADTDIQIIISTHSPLLLSDVLPEQITRLDLDSKGYCLIKNSTEKAYFGANIHTILADGFFLDYTIGEYARLYLQEQLNWLKDALTQEVLDKEEQKHAEELSRVVPLIGDAIIRNSFDMLLKQLEVHHD